MKKFFAVMVMVLFVAGMCACQAIKTDLAKLETKAESIDWAAAQTYWQDFVKGLQASLPVIEALFPGTKSTVDKVVQPVLTDANTAVTTFTNTVQAYKAGTLTEADAVAAAKEVQSSVSTASNVVGQALKGKLGVSDSAKTATSAAVPTSAPAATGSSK